MNFDELYRTYWSKVYRLCMGYVNDYAWAKDIAQDTFIIVWQKLATFRNEAAISTWIFRIAVNNCLRQIERQNRITTTTFPEQIEQKTEPSNDANINFLRQCIAELKEADRIVILLELENLPQAEIAAITGISEANVRVKIHRIKEKLTLKFKQHER